MIGKSTKLAALAGLVAFLSFPVAESQAADATCARVRHAANATSLAGCRFRLDGADAEQTVRRFIEAHAGQFKMPDSPSDLVQTDTAEGLAGRHLRFQQYLFGYPVFGAFVTAHVDHSGTLRRLSSRYRAQLRWIAPGADALTAERAQAIARQLVARADGTVPQGLTVRRSRQVWFSRPDGVLTLAWEIVLVADRPPLDVLLLVDVATGELLARQDRLEGWINGIGKAFRPNPLQASGDTTLSESSNVDPWLVDVSLSQLDEGTALLKGRFVDASVPSLNDPWSGYPVAFELGRQYFYPVADLRFVQVNAYFAADSAQRYVRAMGFSDDRTDPPFGIHSHPITLYTYWYDLDNSFYRPTTDTIHLGDAPCDPDPGPECAGVPDAEDGDIVAHEYGHAIQHAQNPNWGCSSNPECEMRAMGEGFSDYLAATVHANDGNPAYQAAHAACVGEWDSRGYVPPVACLRRVDGTKTYSGLVPGGDRYLDGEIWSATLWDIRNAIGASVASQIILEHHFSLLQDATMPEAAREILEVDAELFGGAYEAALRQVFCDREVLVGAECTPPSDVPIYIAVSKDAMLRENDPNRNEGASPLLRLQGVEADHSKTRIVLAFDLSGIALGSVKSAILEMVVANSNQFWDIHGRTIDVHPLAVDFTEGNGAYTGAPPSLGSGRGATWNCQDDTNIANLQLECTLLWKGGRPPPFEPLGAGRREVPPVVQTKGMTGRVRWNVTADVQANVSRWVVKKTFQDKPGGVSYYSKEGAPSSDFAPRLVITLN